MRTHLIRQLFYGDRVLATLRDGGDCRKDFACMELSAAAASLATTKLWAACVCNDYRQLNFQSVPVAITDYSTDDYRNAPSGIGPLANEWKDKPHRLVYDLCREVERLQ